MAAERTAAELAFAAAVCSLAEIVAKEAKRLASKGALNPTESRAAVDLAQALAALERGPLWATRRILSGGT